MAIRVLALKKHSYAQRPRLPGQAYLADDRHVPILERMGMVKAEAPAAAPPPEEEPARRKPRKRAYKRRDMEAEG